MCGWNMSHKLPVLEARNTTLKSSGLTQLWGFQDLARSLCSIPPLYPACIGSDETRGDIQYLHDSLLLTRGGHSVYAGKRFRTQSFLASIVAFASDVVSVNLQSATKESTSLADVKSQILEWGISERPLNQAPRTSQQPPRSGH